MSNAEKILKIAGAGAVVAAALWLSYKIGYWKGCTLPQPHVEPQRDTLYVRDTIVQNRPIYVTKVKLDSVLVPVTDTVRLHDTTFVWLQREQVQWRDTLCTVYASGIQPQVDSVAHYVTERTIYVPVEHLKKTRWGLGVQVGAGAGKDGLTPYVGVGVSYNLLSW
jgi:hypothetical protein